MCETCGCGSTQHEHTHLVLPVGGMACAHCAQKIEESLQQIDGVAHVQADHLEGTVSVGLTDHGDLAQIKKTIVNLGFDA